jgi:hypothetical protein
MTPTLLPIRGLRLRKGDASPTRVTRKLVFLMISDRSPRVSFLPDWTARSSSFFTTPGPLTPTLITHSGSP